MVSFVPLFSFAFTSFGRFSLVFVSSFPITLSFVLHLSFFFFVLLLFCYSFACFLCSYGMARQGAGGRNGDIEPAWRLQSRLLSSVGRVVSAAPVAVQELFELGVPGLLRRILADYVRCDDVGAGGKVG